MEVLKAIKERRSIRSFKTKKIEKEIINDILNCGRLAPSAKNSQPWYFVIVQDDIKNKIADMMVNYTIKNNNMYKRTSLLYKSSVNTTTEAIKQAPILILIFKEKNDNQIINDNLSIGACVENMCLRATDLGIGSLWIRHIANVAEEVAEMLDHQDMELNCALSLGYSNEFPKMRPRKELKDITQWYE